MTRIPVLLPRPLLPPLLIAQQWAEFRLYLQMLHGHKQLRRESGERTRTHISFSAPHLPGLPLDSACHHWLDLSRWLHSPSPGNMSSSSLQEWEWR